MKRGFTIMELLVVIGIFILMTAVLAPFIQFAKTRANAAKCVTNLRKISLGLHEYAARHDGDFPEGLGSLYPDYVDDEKVFDCPATKKIGSKIRPEYLYFTGLRETSSPNEIIARDLDGNHGKTRVSILRLDGVVEWKE